MKATLVGTMKQQFGQDLHCFFAIAACLRLWPAVIEARLMLLLMLSQLLMLPMPRMIDPLLKNQDARENATCNAISLGNTLRTDVVAAALLFDRSNTA